jgi:hypothetical protein
MNQNLTWMFPVRGQRKDKSLSRVMFVDPGLTGTGWALFETIKCNAGVSGARGYFEGPRFRGVLRPKKSVQWEGRAAVIAAWLEGVIASSQPKVVVIEWPQVWQTQSGQGSIASGSFSKLCYLCGTLAEVVRRAGLVAPVLVEPSRWKGQLPKATVLKRIRRRFPKLGTLPDHEGDAVGMGLAAQGGL